MNMREWKSLLSKMYGFTDVWDARGRVSPKYTYIFLMIGGILDATYYMTSLYL